MKSVCVAGVALLALSACASGEQQAAQVDTGLKQATASAVAGAKAEDISVSQQVRKGGKWTWRAQYQGKTFACDADDEMRLPSCAATT